MLVSSIMIAQTLSNSWSELLTSVLSPKQIGRYGRYGKSLIAIGPTFHRRGVDAYELVLFQVVPSPLHIDVFLGCELCAHPVIGSGTGFDVLAKPGFKSFFQILALQAVHGYLSSASVHAQAVGGGLLLSPLCKDLLLGSEAVLLILFGSQPVLLVLSGPQPILLVLARFMTTIASIQLAESIGLDHGQPLSAVG